MFENDGNENDNEINNNEDNEINKNKFLDEIYNKNFKSSNIEVIDASKLEKFKLKMNNKDEDKKDIFFKHLINANSSIYKNILVSDISNVNFNKYYSKNDLLLEPIKNIFSDNINVFIPMSLSSVDKIGRKLTWKKAFNNYCRSIINSIFDKAGLNVKQNISGVSVIPYIFTDEIKNKFKLNDEKNKDMNNTKNHIKEIINTDSIIAQKIKKYMDDLLGIDKNNLFFINFKIGLEDIKFRKIFKTI